MLKNKQLFFYMILFLTFNLPVCAGAAAAEKDPPPLAASIILNKAGKHIEKKDFTGAIKILDAFQARGKTIQNPVAATKKGYNHYLIDFTLGNCYLSANRPRRAIDHYLAATGKAPRLSSAWLNLAKCYYDLGQHGKAARAFLSGYESADKKQAKTLYYSLVSFMAATEYSRAMEIIKRLTQLPDNHILPEWKEHFVQVFMAAGKPKKALPYLRQLAEKSSGKKKKQWQETLLHQYISLDMNKKALAYAWQLTREDPVEKKWWKAIANLNLSQGKHKKALTALTLYHYLTPLSPREKRLMADLNMMLGMPARAVSFYENLPDKEKNADVVNYLASGYLRLHRSDMALAAVEKGLQDTKDDRLLMLKGRILYEMKRYKAAARVFETAARKKHQPGKAWLMLGYAAWNLADTKQAKHAFKEAAKFPGQQKNAAKMLAMLRKINLQ